ARRLCPQRNATAERGADRRGGRRNAPRVRRIEPPDPVSSGGAVGRQTPAHSRARRLAVDSLRRAPRARDGGAERRRDRETERRRAGGIERRRHNESDGQYVRISLDPSISYSLSPPVSASLRLSAPPSPCLLHSVARQPRNRESAVSLDTGRVAARDGRATARAEDHCATGRSDLREERRTLKRRRPSNSARESIVIRSFRPERRAPAPAETAARKRGFRRIERPGHFSPPEFPQLGGRTDSENGAAASGLPSALLR